MSLQSLCKNKADKMPDNFNGKNIWIIGASSGIGRALAVHLSGLGAHLILSARSTDKLESLNNDLGAKHDIVTLDVSDDNALKNAVNHITAKGKKIDSVIFLAALYDPTDLSHIDVSKTKKMFDVNVMGAFRLIDAVLPELKKQQAGQLVLCGSVAGYRGLPQGQPYSATKAAVISIAESLKSENPSLDIKLISPGFVETPLTEKNDFDMPMMITADQAASAIAKGLQSSCFEIHFPKKFTYGMKLIKILPSFLYFKVATFLKTDDKK